jgi:hypothetical protein
MCVVLFSLRRLARFISFFASLRRQVKKATFEFFALAGRHAATAKEHWGR